MSTKIGSDIGTNISTNIETDIGSYSIWINDLYKR
jgi:hypothetical protein